MKVYLAKEFEPGTGRAHPYQESDWSKYYDFKKNPKLIPEVLEDFKPWAHYPAAQVFYNLLLWLNGVSSRLESSDCAFKGPSTNTDVKFQKKMQCSGRLMLFFRQIPLNVVPENTEVLKSAINHYLEQLEPDFEWGVVGISSMPTKYVEIPEQSRRAGTEVMLTFWAWGDDENETMENLQRLFHAMRQCLSLVSEDMAAAGC